MPPEQRDQLTLIVCLIGATLLLAGCRAADEEPSARAKFRLPKLVDFEQFKRIFGKRYNSMLEELSRKKLFVARLLSAFVSTVDYKLGRLTSYLSVNPTSDWTIEERRRTMISGEQLGSGIQSLTRVQRPLVGQPVDGSVDSAAVELALGEVARHKQSDAFKALARELEQSGAIDPRTSGASRGSWLNSWMAGFLNHLQSDPDGSPQWYEDGSYDETPPAMDSYAQATKLPDRLFVDHRRTGCMPEVGDQGTCGACYAFTTTAYFGYQLCRQTGDRAPLSEQFIIDCGHHSGTKGCQGGSIMASFNFVRQFGLERADKQPFRWVQGQCANESELKPVGSVRWHETGSEFISSNKWLDRVHESPIYVGVYLSAKFHDYGGGVATNDDCSEDYGHAMLLVGYGREDGKEYALLRNSHSKLWGEEGYYKMASDAIAGCAICPGYVSRGHFEPT